MVDSYERELYSVAGLEGGGGSTVAAADRPPLLAPGRGGVG